MRALKPATAVAIGAALLVLATACGGGSGGKGAANTSSGGGASDHSAAGQTTATPSGGEAHPRTPGAASGGLVSAATDILGASAESFIAARSSGHPR